MEGVSSDLDLDLDSDAVPLSEDEKAAEADAANENDNDDGFEVIPPNPDATPPDFWIGLQALREAGFGGHRAQLLLIKLHGDAGAALAQLRAASPARAARGGPRCHGGGRAGRHGHGGRRLFNNFSSADHPHWGAEDADANAAASSEPLPDLDQDTNPMDGATPADADARETPSEEELFKSCADLTLNKP